MVRVHELKQRGDSMHDGQYEAVQLMVVQPVQCFDGWRHGHLIGLETVQIGSWFGGVHEYVHVFLRQTA